MSHSNQPGNGAVSAMLDWCFEHGAVAPDMEIRNIDGVRGAYAVRDIAPGTPVITVPPCLFLHAPQIEASSLGERLKAAGAKINDQALLAVGLLELRRSGGFWQPYVQALPDSFDEITRFLRTESEWLTGSSVPHIMGRLFRLAMREFRQVRKAFRAPLPHAREWWWARTAAASRSFLLRVDGEARGGMVPLADMVNCDFPPNTAWNGNHSTAFELTAIRPIARDEQISASYGPWANASTMAQSGFAIEDNPFDTVRVCFRFEPDHFVAQLNPASAATDGAHWFCFGRSYAHRDTATAFSFLRLNSMPSLSAALLAKSSGALALVRIPPQDAASECAMLARLAIACEERLSAFAQPLAVDEALLRQPGLQPTQRFAVITRSGEKRILHELLEVVRQARAALELPPPARARALAHLAMPDGPYADYFDELRRMEMRATAA